MLVGVYSAGALLNQRRPEIFQNQHLSNKFWYDAPPGLDQRVEDGAGIAFGEGGGNRGEEAEEEEFEDEYWDTEDFKLTRRGLWLRLRRMEGSSGSECWQLRKLEHRSKLNLVTEEKAVANRLKEELGMEGVGEPEVTEVLLSNHFKKMLAFHGSKSRWRIGVVEVEVRRENKMDTAVVKVVGEVMAALQELHSNAEMLHLMPLHVRTFGAGGGGVVSGAA